MIKHTLYILLILVFAGCGRKEKGQYIPKDPGEYVGNDIKQMSELNDDAVILIVNGVSFTKKDFNDTCSVFDKMLRMKHGVPLTGFNPKAYESLEKMRPNILSRIMRSELVHQFAREKNIQIKDGYFNEVAANVLKSINRGHSTFDSVCAEMGDETVARKFRTLAECEALEFSLRDLFDTNGILNIAESDVISYSNRYMKSIGEAERKNKEQVKQLEEALEKIASGVDFAEAGLKYSDSKDGKEEAEFWDEYYKEDFDGEDNLESWAMTAKKGDVSGILEMDDGYSIVRLNDIRQDQTDPDDESSTETVWEFGRIRKDLFESLPQLTHDEIVAALTEGRKERIQKIVGEEIMKTAVIEWPYGTNLFENAKN